jgi:hypothetical protein
MATNAISVIWKPKLPFVAFQMSWELRRSSGCRWRWVGGEGHVFFHFGFDVVVHLGIFQKGVTETCVPSRGDCIFGCSIEIVRCERMGVGIHGDRRSVACLRGEYQNDLRLRSSVQNTSKKKNSSHQ